MIGSNLHPIFQQALAPFIPGILDGLKAFPPAKATDADEPPKEDSAKEAGETS